MKKRGAVFLMVLILACLALLIGAAVLSGMVLTQSVTEMRSDIERTATALATQVIIPGGEVTATSQAGATQTRAAERVCTLRAQQDRVGQAIQATQTAKARLALTATPR
jgi:hypothetical protein